ncbi:MAG: hypothetical protein M3025_04370, partial [Actinomycetota bacterium]|nr:hypothetical protein [Actinomycetota bacterium]
MAHDDETYIRIKGPSVRREIRRVRRTRPNAGLLQKPGPVVSGMPAGPHADKQHGAPTKSLGRRLRGRRIADDAP